MTDLKYQQHILDTIDHLRRRKARPDAERIFHALTKKYSLSYTDAKIALERSVETGAVLRVEYKGNISYRNAARKNSHFRRERNGDIGELKKFGPSRKFTLLVTNAIAELVLQEPDYLQWGVPAQELIKNILAKNSVKYTRKYVSILLEKEVECGGLIRMENGNFLVGPTKIECVPPPRAPNKVEHRETADFLRAVNGTTGFDCFAAEAANLKKLPHKVALKRFKSDKMVAMRQNGGGFAGIGVKLAELQGTISRVGGRRKVSLAPPHFTDVYMFYTRCNVNTRVIVFFFNST